MFNLTQMKIVCDESFTILKTDTLLLPSLLFLIFILSLIQFSSLLELVQLIVQTHLSNFWLFTPHYNKIVSYSEDICLQTLTSFSITWVKITRVVGRRAFEVVKSLARVADGNFPVNNRRQLASATQAVKSFAHRRISNTIFRQV